MTAAITDADREAASPAMVHLYGNRAGTASDELFRRDVLAGKFDDHYLIQAFAAHRIQARKEAIEEAAAYLDGYAGGHYMAQSCAAAIRALGEQL